MLNRVIMEPYFKEDYTCNYAIFLKQLYESKAYKKINIIWVDFYTINQVEHFCLIYETST